MKIEFRNSIPRTQAHAGTTRLLASAVIGLSLLMPSCAAPEARDELPKWMGDVALDEGAPAQTLARIAAREREDDVQRARSLDVPAPPGVDPALLAVRPDNDLRARMNLEAAIIEITDEYPWAEVMKAAAEELRLGPAEAIEPEVQTAALRHYIRGRDAMHENRIFAAVTELQRALELDPHSPAIIRELARGYLGTGNQARATEMYMRLAIIEPGDPEALFMMGLSAAARRDHQLAVATFGQRLVQGESFPHDPAADLLTAYVLSGELHELGYDRASIQGAAYVVDVPEDLAELTIYAAQVRSIIEQKGDLWRRIGDAHARLGQFDRALEAYNTASNLPMAEPATLHPRSIYVSLRLGRPFAAQLELFQLLERSAPKVSDREVRLTAYVGDHAGDVRWLRAAVLELYRQHSGEASLARAAATLLPPNEARDLLEEFIERQPRDVHVVAHLLSWLGSRDLQSAVELTAALVKRHPDLSGQYVNRLAHSVPWPEELLKHVERLPSAPEREVIRSRLLAVNGSLGEAWQVAGRARERWPDARLVFWLQLDLVSLLEESLLLDEVLQHSDHFDSPWSWIIRGRVHRSLGRINEAIDAHERALREAENLAYETDAERAALVTAMIELGQSYLHFGAVQPGETERRRWAHEAVDLAERALVMDEQREDGFELLIAIYGPDGPLRDPQRFRRIALRLYERDPEGRLYTRAAASEAIAQRRYEEAIERLLTLYENTPYDPTSLTMLITAWSQANRLDDALHWLNEQLEERPGNPALLENWVNVELRRSGAEEVIDHLRAMAEQAYRTRPSRAVIARRLLEAVYRGQGRIDEAFALGEQRLLNRPRGIQREIELAAMYGGVGQHNEAIARLEWVADRAEHASLSQFLTAIAILGRIDPGDEVDSRLAELTVTLVERTIVHYPEAPLQVHGSGLRALSRQRQFGERFDSIAEHASRYALHASGSSIRSAAMWRDLAQALVDDGHALAAARALRVRLLDDSPLEREAIDLLGAVALAAFAAASAEDEDGEEIGDETVILVQDLAARERLPRLFPIEGVPTTADVLFHASSFFTLAGRTTASERLLRAVVEIRPDHGIALNNLGYGRIERGYDDEQTVRWISRAYELEPGEASVIDTMGWLRYRQGRFEDENSRDGALTLLRSSHELTEEPSAEVLDHLGDVYWRVGERARAVEAWSEAAAILTQPEHREQWTQNLYLLQTRGWGLLVADPVTLYHQQFGRFLERLQKKIDAAERGDQPDIAPTFEELRQ